MADLNTVMSLYLWVCFAVATCLLVGNFAVVYCIYYNINWSVKVTERQKLNLFEMKCLTSMTGVSHLNRVRNEVVRERMGVMRELAARVDMNVLRWLSCGEGG